MNEESKVSKVLYMTLQCCFEIKDIKKYKLEEYLKKSKEFKALCTEIIDSLKEIVEDEK